MNYKEYENPEELQKLQRLSVDLLRELDRVCRELDIPYFAYGGTAIGAVRHGGFIPWDDDIDIGFLRADFERFLREAPEHLGPAYEVVSSRSEEYFPACNANLSLKGTLCVPEEFDNCPYQYEIGLGLYPFDVLVDDDALLRRQCRSTWLWGRLKFLCATPRPYVPFGGWKRSLVLFCCRCAHGMLRLFHVSPRWVQHRWDKAAMRYDDRPSDRVADFSDRDPKRWSARLDDLFPLVEMDFDGVTIFLPRGYDALLSRGYGDYMALPPVEERKNHYPSVLDFGAY
ncbi:MAG: LicD family protein [Eggerthellaceae bacterium]|nr:LicD family protein [Eggerthellaceae bacterium]